MHFALSLLSDMLKKGTFQLHTFVQFYILLDLYGWRLCELLFSLISFVYSSKCFCDVFWFNPVRLLYVRWWHASTRRITHCFAPRDDPSNHFLHFVSKFNSIHDTLRCLCSTNIHLYHNRYQIHPWETEYWWLHNRCADALCWRCKYLFVFTCYFRSSQRWVMIENLIILIIFTF